MARKKLSAGGFVVPMWSDDASPSDLMAVGLRQDFDSFILGERHIVTVISGSPSLDPVRAAAQYRRDVLQGVAR